MQRRFSTSTSKHYRGTNFINTQGEAVNKLNKPDADEQPLPIHHQNPKTKKNSETPNRLLRRRFQIAQSLYEKGVVNAAKAAEIAGMSIKEFYEKAPIEEAEPLPDEMEAVKRKENLLDADKMFKTQEKRNTR